MTSLPESASEFPDRKYLPHEIPHWVGSGSRYFITICCRKRGVNQLCGTEISAAVLASVRHRHEKHDWYAWLVLLMPDHLHAILSFPPDKSLAAMIRLWKGYLARRHGIEWQRDFFEHRLRNTEEAGKKGHYIRQNPVRAGLVVDVKDWPHIWEPS